MKQGTASVANGDTTAARDHATAGVSPLPRYARPAVAGLLLIAALAGVHVATAGIGQRGPWRDKVVVLALLLELALVLLLAALQVIRRRRRNPGHPAAVLRMLLQRAIIIAMAAAAVLATLDRLRLRPLRRRPTPAQHGRPRIPKLPSVLRNRNGAAVSQADVAYGLYGLLALLLLAAIVACVVVILRRTPAGPVGYLAEAEDDDGPSLEQAVESGRIALRALDDARAAIIACYVAMEASLGEAGATRKVAETPDELLARAMTSGLLQGRAAARLTALFYEARFSSHPLPATARDAASRALDEISAELSRPGDRQPAAATGTQP